MCYGWTIRTIIFFDFLELSRIINILIVRQLFHPGLTIGSRHRCTYNITIITTMTERWNIRVKTIARGLSFSRTLSFSNPLFRAIRHLFFDLFSSFLSSSSFFSFFYRKHHDYCQPCGSQWVTSGCNFNEPVVSGMSHGYHGTDCRQLKLLCPGVVTN